MKSNSKREQTINAATRRRIDKIMVGVMLGFTSGPGHTVDGPEHKDQIPPGQVTEKSLDLQWAESGFPCIVPPGPLAAAMIGSTGLDGLSMPWPVFEVVVPPATIRRWSPAAQQFVDIASVSVAQIGAPINEALVAHDSVSVRVRDTELARGVLVRVFDAHGRDTYTFASTLDGLALFSNGLLNPTDVTELAAESRNESAARAMELAARLVVGCIAELEGDAPVQRERHATGRGTRPSSPSAGIWKLMRSVRVDVRAACLSYCTGGGKAPTVRTLVCGHYKWQAHGPEGALRKRIHVMPYWRGPIDGAVAMRPHILS